MVKSSIACTPIPINALFCTGFLHLLQLLLDLSLRHDALNPSLIGFLVIFYWILYSVSAFRISPNQRRERLQHLAQNQLRLNRITHKSPQVLLKTLTIQAEGGLTDQKGELTGAEGDF
jgi:hypothetical protein